MWKPDTNTENDESYQFKIINHGDFYSIMSVRFNEHWYVGEPKFNDNARYCLGWSETSDPENESTMQFLIKHVSKDDKQAFKDAQEEKEKLAAEAAEAEQKRIEEEEAEADRLRVEEEDRVAAEAEAEAEAERVKQEEAEAQRIVDEEAASEESRLAQEAADAEAAEA